MRLPLIRLILLGLCPAVFFSPVVLGQVDREHFTAIIVEADPPVGDSCRSQTTSFSLAIALQSYLDFYLSQHGYRYTLIQATSSPLIKQLANLPENSIIDRVITVKPEGRFYSAEVPMLARNRRAYRQIVADQLSLRLRYRQYSRRGDDWVEAGSGVIKEGAKRRWLVPPLEESDRVVDSVIAVTPEPIEFILMRAAQRLLSRTMKPNHDWTTIRDRETALFNPLLLRELDSNTLAIDVIVDARHAGQQRNWRADTDRMLLFADHLLHGQFGLNLVFSDTRTVQLGQSRVEPLSLLFRRFLSIVPSESNRLKIGLHSFPTALHFFQIRDHDAVGLSDRGSGRLLIREFPSTRRETDAWRPFLTARTFVHEFGHTFGGIHVSDLNSIMNHSATWLAPFRFDPLNREILAAALAGDLEVSDNVAYARFLAATLDRLQYRLADYPPVFYHILESAEGSGDAKRLLTGVGKQYLLAGKGYGALAEGRLKEAAESFREAIRLSPDQAALHYYLSSCTRGQEAAEALATAARLGYQLAKERLR